MAPTCRQHHGGFEIGPAVEAKRTHAPDRFKLRLCEPAATSNSSLRATRCIELGFASAYVCHLVFASACKARGNPCRTHDALPDDGLPRRALALLARTTVGTRGRSEVDRAQRLSMRRCSKLVLASEPLHRTRLRERLCLSSRLCEPAQQAWQSMPDTRRAAARWIAASRSRAPRKDDNGGTRGRSELGRARHLSMRRCSKLSFTSAYVCNFVFASLRSRRGNPCGTQVALPKDGLPRRAPALLARTTARTGAGALS